MWYKQLLLSSLITCGLTGPAFCADVLLAKLGVDSVDQNLKIEVALQMHLFASYEVYAERCGRHPNFEVRAMRAIAPCVQPDSLALIMKTFRAAKDRARSSPSQPDCESDLAKRNLGLMSSDMEGMIRTLDRMCRACLIC